jgi:NAD(P)-dependent dehydrogenase (short-subunit alcohol dehydrogenase family)
VSPAGARGHAVPGDEAPISLDGRVAVVTGASAGLGAAYARALGAAGARLVVTARRAEPLEALARELPQAVAVAGDIADPAFGDRVAATAVSAFGRIDVLVNNAGGVRDRTLLKMTDEEFDEVVKAHVYGPFHVTRACARVMREQRAGTIINIGSDSGMCGAFGQTNYAAAKGAVLGLTLTWARELERYGVTCNCVLPNALTAMTEDLPDLLDEYRYGPPGENFPRAIGAPEEVAPLIVLLASERWSRLNGRLLSLGGDKLAIWRPPEEHWTAYLQGGWSLADLAAARELELELGLDPAPPPSPEPSTADHPDTGSPHGTAHT